MGFRTCCPRDHPSGSRRALPVGARRAESCPRQAGPRRPGPRRHHPHRRARPPTVRRPARQPPPRPGRPLAAQLRRGVLHDRLGRPRGQRGVAAALRPSDPGPAALPLRCVLLRPGRPGPRQRRDPRRAARAGRLGQGADRRRPAQGLRQRRPARHPDHLDDRLAPAPRRSVSPTPSSAGDGCRGWARRPPAGPTTPSWSARSATRRSTTPVPPPRSTRPAGATTPACGCRCCSCARTTASASASARPTAGSRRRCAAGPGSSTSPPTAATWPSAYDAAVEAASWVRRQRRPAVLHLSTIRLMGHAGADAELAYRSQAEITADLDRDPLLATAKLLVDAGLATPDRTAHPVRRDRLGGPPRRRGGPRRAEARLGRSRSPPRSHRRPVRVARAIGDAHPVGRTGRRGQRLPRPTPRQATGRPAPTGSDAQQRRPHRACRPPARGERRPHARPDHQRDAHRRAARVPADGVCSARTSPPRAASTASRRACGTGSGRAGSSTPCSTRPRSSASGSAPGWAGCCRCPRSSTWRTCTTPRTSCAARPPPCSSSRRAPTATRWSCGSPAWPTRRASAGTSTTTTPSPCCATSRASSSRCRRGPRTPARCCGPASRRPSRRRQRLRVSWSRSRSTTPVTCTPTATARGWRRTPRRADWMRRPRADRAGPGLRLRPGEDLTIITFGNGVRMSLRAAARLAGRGHRLPRRRPALAVAAARRRHHPGSVGHRPGAGRRRDPPQRRSRRRRAGRAGRRRVRRSGPPGRSRGLVRAARPRRGPRTGIRRTR